MAAALGAVVVSIDNASSADLGAAMQGKLEAAIAADMERVDAAFSAAVSGFMTKGKAELRGDILAGGFQRANSLAKSWRGNFYSNADKGPLGEAGQFVNKASVIIDAFTVGATITVSGAKFLAIPQGPAKGIIQRLNQGSNRSRNGFGRFAREPNPVERVASELGVDLVPLINKATGHGVLVAKSPVRLTPRGRMAKRQTGENTVLFVLVKSATLRKRIRGRALLADLGARFPGEVAADIAARLGADTAP